LILADQDTTISEKAAAMPFPSLKEVTGTQEEKKGWIVKGSQWHKEKCQVSEKELRE